MSFIELYSVFAILYTFINPNYTCWFGVHKSTFLKQRNLPFAGSRNFSDFGGFILLSNKMNDDATFTNKSWEQASGIPLSVLNRRKKWLNEVKFNLAVTKYEANISVLDQCWKTWVNKYGSCHSEPPSSPTYYTPEVDVYYYSSHHHSYSSPISYLQHSYSNPYPQHQQCNYQYQYQPQYQPTTNTQYLVPQPPPPPPPPSYYDPAIVSVNYGGFIYT